MPFLGLDFRDMCTSGTYVQIRAHGLPELVIVGLNFCMQ